MLNNNIQNIVSTSTASMTADLNRIKQEGAQVASLAGGYSAILTSGLSGDNHSQIAENIYISSRVGRNAGENNAYFAERPLDLGNKKSSKFFAKSLSNLHLDKMDEKNIKLVHEQIFFEDAQGGNVGFFDNSQVQADNPRFLNQYKTTITGFDDSIMREAVNNLSNRTRPYDLLGLNTCTGKFNCQDWAASVRAEYNQLEIQRNLKIWDQIIQPQVNLNQ